MPTATAAALGIISLGSGARAQVRGESAARSGRAKCFCPMAEPPHAWRSAVQAPAPGTAVTHQQQPKGCRPAAAPACTELRQGHSQGHSQGRRQLPRAGSTTASPSICSATVTSLKIENTNYNIHPGRIAFLPITVNGVKLMYQLIWLLLKLSLIC